MRAPATPAARRAEGLRIRFFNTFEPVVPLYRDLLPRLASRGHQVDVLVANHDYRPTAPWPATAGLRWRKMPLPHLPLRSDGARKGLAHLSYAVAASALSLTSRRRDLNVFLTQPPLFTAWGPVLQVLRGQPYVLVAMDLYPWVAVEAGVLTSGNGATRALERVGTAAMGRAEAIIVIGRCMADRVRSLGVPPSRIHLVPNWSNTQAIVPLDRRNNPLRRELGLENELVVLYAGNIGIPHYLNDILAVAHQLREHRDIVFVFVGRGARHHEIDHAIEMHRLDNVRCLDHQPSDQLAQTLSLGDVHFISLRRGFEGLVVPSKAYSAMAAGRPIIYQGSRAGEVAQMVAEERLGFVTPEGDIEGLRRCVLETYRRDAWRDEVGARARALAEARYGMGRAVDAYTAVLERAGDGPAEP